MEQGRQKKTTAVPGSGHFEDWAEASQRSSLSPRQTNIAAIITQK